MKRLNFINYIFFNKNKSYYYIFKIIFLIYSIFNSFILKDIKIKFKNKKIGVISCNHHKNIGNNLIKYSIFIILTNYGFEPYIIGTNPLNFNISFLKKYVNIRTVKNFSEINENDYEILIVNSDQTWRKWDKDFYDIAFLKFAKNWNINKFVYAASLGFNSWVYSKKDQKIARKLLKNFTGISIREKGSVKLIQKYLGFKPSFVLDPTLLINKKYYLKIIKYYKNDKNFNFNYILTYKVFFTNSNIPKAIDIFIKKASLKLKYKIFQINMYEEESIEKFLYGIYNSKAVITNSYHATIFSIIFNKPFISFYFNNDERLISLRQLLCLEKRIIKYTQIPDYNLLIEIIK